MALALTLDTLHSATTPHRCMPTFCSCRNSQGPPPHTPMYDLARGEVSKLLDQRWVEGLSSSLLHLSILLRLSLPLGNSGFSPFLECVVSAGSSGPGGWQGQRGETQPLGGWGGGEKLQYGGCRQTVLDGGGVSRRLDRASQPGFNKHLSIRRSWLPLLQDPWQRTGTSPLW